MAETAYLIDTTILVDFLRGRREAKAWLVRFPEGELAISVITAPNCWRGLPQSSGTEASGSGA